MVLGISCDDILVVVVGESGAEKFIRKIWRPKLLDLLL